MLQGRDTSNDTQSNTSAEDRQVFNDKIVLISSCVSRTTISPLSLTSLPKRNLRSVDFVKTALT